MGSYVGVRVHGRLIAMAGERLRLEEYPELSGICTHPEHRGKGLAAGLIGHLVEAHRLRRDPRALTTRDAFGCLRRKMRHNPTP
jgi:predicted GNAT family acetyltransferase